MKIQEASKDFKEGGILYSGPKTTYMEANTQNDGKIGNLRLGHGLQHAHMCLGHGVCVMCTEKCGAKAYFHFFVGKARVSSPNPGGNSPYKFRLPHS